MTNHVDGEVACVTGGTGLIGRHIVKVLLNMGYEVRILSGKEQRAYDGGASFFRGNMEEKDSLARFLRGGRLLFHCAGETKDETKMREINVHGTKRLVSLLKDSGIEYFCHLSSAGVIGRTNHKWVDESTPCTPQNPYEVSKRDAEQAVLQGLFGSRCRTVILRPTNVIGNENAGALGLSIGTSWSDWLKVFLKGAECAHIVHAEDVARAAVHLISRQGDAPSCYFVSCDHEELNTFAGLWSLYRASAQNRPVENMKLPPHLPLLVPYVLRKLWRRTGNPGDVRYSSAKLLSTGFNFHLGVEGAVRQIALSRQNPQ